MSSSSDHRRSKSRGPPIIDMSSIKPFSHPRGSGTGGSTAFTQPTAATSSSDESRRSGASIGRHSFHEPSRRRDERQHDHRKSTSSAAVSVGHRGRSKSRPREISRSSYSSGPSSPRAVVPSSSKASSSRGRSHSRPRDKTLARGRSMSIKRVEETPLKSSSQNQAVRGRSLGPTKASSSTSSRGRSQSRSRVSSSATSHQTSRSRSRARPTSSSQSQVRKSVRGSMETMEEEKDEDISDRTLKYSASTPESEKNARLARSSFSARKLNAAVSVLEAVNAAAASHNNNSSDSKHRRGKSLPRNSTKDAASAAIAAALNEVNKIKKADPLLSSSSSHYKDLHVKSKSHKEERPAQHQQHHPKSNNKDVRTFQRKLSQSLSPQRSKSITTPSKSISSSKKNRCQSFDITNPEQDEEASVASSTSSTFSSYDRKISRNFAMLKNNNNDTSEMAICTTQDGNNNTNSTNALLDKDGCCALHPFIQLKLKLPGKNQWKTLSRSCVVCQEEERGNGKTKFKSIEDRMILKPRRSSESWAGKRDGQEKKIRSSLPVMLGESGECSLTPSFLEEEDEEECCPSKKRASDDASEDSSRGSVNSFVEHKTKTSVACSSRATSHRHAEHGNKTTSHKAELPPLEVSIPNKMTSSLDEHSFKSKPSLDLSFKGGSVHSAEQDDIKSVRSTATSRRRTSHRMGSEHDDAKSVKSTRSYSTSKRTSHRTGNEHDDAKSVRSTMSNATSRRLQRNQKSLIDMSKVDSVVESALQKIKSMDEMNHAPAEAVQAATATRSHPPPPPPPPRSQSLKNLTGNNNNKVHPKPVPPPPSTNHNVSSNSNNGSSSTNALSVQRPPPPRPPPPPRSQMKSVNSVASGIADRAYSPSSATPPAGKESIDYDCSMNVLNPDPEPELQNDFMGQNDFDEMIPPFEQMEVSGMGNDVAQGVGAPVVNAPADDWKKYCITSSGRDGKDTKSTKKRIFGRSAKNAVNEREIIRSVRQMPFTDQFGDYGLYTGQVNEDGRPDGKGSMKYDNGVFYEGTWTNGGQDQKAAQQYERIRGGFTSWKGQGSARTKSGSTLPWNARKNDTVDVNEKTNVRGMEYTDLNGDSGRYTGEVNGNELPHGHGIMKYDFGLIAEGEWSNGVLKENPQDRMMAAVPGAGAAMGSGRSIGPGMSVGPGAQGFSAGASVMGSVMGGAASVMGGAAYPAMPMYGAGAMNPMMMGASPAMAHPGQFTMMAAQQNAMMKGMYGGGSVYGGGSAYGGGSVYGGGGSTYGGSAYGPMMPQVQMQGVQGQQPSQPAPANPPISEIKIN